MRRQRNMFKIKEKDKAQEKELKMVTSNLTDTEFKTLIIRMLSDLSENFDKEIENIKIEIEDIKKNQSEIRNIITEIKNTVEGIKSRLDESED